MKHRISPLYLLGAAAAFIAVAGPALAEEATDLYEEARRKGIEGRSKMNKAQLEKAVGR